ncbi:DUF742 domain-containing protein [Streptomyces hesseae]|uniref:DUF742 domain-containing protein n=1 Tax=Streptomyces hesseae TaxID=3075519 RepID=A0ABU2SQ52_9ACTN|nr:DUF742 domain-containing protein [Streptomyces sp. DSM 40473]MDT0450044.1 DUF742 domain-containing protein [Streptomyces sp. DSM 40473]
MTEDPTAFPRQTPSGPTAGTTGRWGPAARPGAAPGGEHTAQWYDDAAGPVVRPYTMTRGRTKAPAEGRLDLIALVVAEEFLLAHPGGAYAIADRTLSPEHLDIADLARREPHSIAELAATLDLPVGVVRVLVGDLIDAGYVRVSRPVPPAELPDAGVLREVIDGLRAL